MNRLRVFSVSAGITLLTFAIWGTVHYQQGALTPPFIIVFLLGIVCLFLRPAVQHWQLWWRRRKQRKTLRDTQIGQTFVSETTVGDTHSLLQPVRDSLSETDDFDLRVKEFPEGEGLIVVHSSFHNAFLRISRARLLVITGGTEMTPKLADEISAITGMSFVRRSVNPMLRKRPVRGKPRFALWIFLCVFVFVGVSVGTTGAYAADTYNSAERTVLVSIDARGVFDPTVSPVETRVSKAAFLVTVMEEEAVEIYWEGNRSRRIITHAEQATRISAYARALIADTQHSNPRRANRLSARLRSAEMNISTALCTAIEKDRTNRTVDAQFNELRRELLSSSLTNTTQTQPRCSRNTS